MKTISQFVVSTLAFYPPAVRFSSHPFDDSLKQAVIPYDFATMGGTVGSRDLPGILPSDAVIFGGFIENLTPPTSAASTATIALGIEGAADLKAALIITSWTGRIAVIPVWTASSSIKTTAEQQVAMTVAVQALTAGQFNIHLFYALSRTFRF